MCDIRVSVIIATYNTAEYIEECLDSIVSQTLKPIEIIVIDDGSTDNTQEILSKYADKYSNMIVCHQENRGAGIARNRGIAIAKGEYMVFADPDDKYPVNDCLEVMYNASKVHNVLICGGNIIGNDEGKKNNIYIAGNGVDGQIKNNLIQSRDFYHLYGHQRYMFKSDFMKKEKIVFAHYKRYEDQVLTIDALGKAEKFYEIDYPVYEYRINHKDNEYDRNTYLDIFKGFRDTIKLICFYEMKLMYEKNCHDFINNYMPKICKYTYKNDADFDLVIEEINDVMRKSGWSDERNLITVDRVEQKRKYYQNIKMKMDNICKKNEKIIIYGAGNNTRCLLKHYGDRLKNTMGIAVTKKNGIDNLGTIAVHEIEEYLSVKDEVMVLVTPSSKVKDSIFSVLDELGFKKYEWIDVNFIYSLF